MRTPSVVRRSAAASTLQLVGLLLLGFGLGLLQPWLGVAVLGAGLLAVGIALEVGG